MGELHGARNSLDQNLTHIIRSRSMTRKVKKKDVRTWIDNVKNSVSKSNSKDQYIKAVINTFNSKQNNNNKQQNKKLLEETDQRAEETDTTIENDANEEDDNASSTIRIPWRWLEK